MSKSARGDLERVLDLERARPLADIRIASNHTVAPVSNALHEAADNLLHKAVRALVEGDDARARRFVERALDLPFDEHEEIGPAWWSASKMIFNSITDYLEDCEVGDDSWLTAAEHVLDGCDPLATPAVLGCLAALVSDYSMSAAEARRCRRVVAATGYDAWDEHEPADRAQCLAAILAVLHCVIAYESYGDDAAPPR